MHAFIFSTQWLSEYEIKFGGHHSSRGAITVLKKACFGTNLHYIAHSSTRGFSTLTRAHGLIKGQE